MNDTLTARPRLILRSLRLYLWPIILLNVLAITVYLGERVFQAALVAFGLCLLASFGFLINDLRDRTVDRANNAGRLEHATSTELRLARLLAGGLACAGLTALGLVSVLAMVVGVGISLGLIAYTQLLRSAVGVAAGLAALLSTSPVWAPAVIWQTSPEPFFLTVCAAAWTILVGREILLDVKDLPGDASSGRRTLPMIIGAPAAQALSTLIIAAGSIALIAASARWEDTATVATATVIATSVLIPVAIGFMHRTREAQQIAITSSRLGMALLAVLWLTAL